ncbi:MAG: helix-turn-helix domain-containing protein [bacterium]
MQPSINTWAILLLFAAVQGLFLAAVLLTHRRGNRRANCVLAVLIFLFALRLVETVGYWTKYLYTFPHFWLSTASFSFLFGPLLYFYAKFLTGKNLEPRRKDVWHLLPFFFHLAWLIPFYRLPQKIKLGIMEKYIAVENPQMEWPYFILFLAQISQMLYYTWLTLRLIKERTISLKENSLALEYINLIWLKRLTRGFGACVWLTLLYMLALQGGLPYSRAIDALVLLSQAVLIYGISYVALRQPEIFSGAFALKNAPKYEKSTLTPARATAYVSKLLHVMENEKLFARSELKLQDLAHKMDVSPHHLSQIINEKLGQNFFDFVNHYRVAEAQKLLADPQKQHFTILSLALEVGFNNKASFNTAFKKYTGMTPSQFRDAHVKPDKI